VSITAARRELSECGRICATLMTELAMSSLVSEAIRSFGQVRLKVAGCSMLPALRPGDVVLVERAESHEFKAGDVVQIVLDGHLVCHRLIRGQGGGFVTRGDASPHADPPVEADQILGRVSRVLRAGRDIDPRLTWPRRLTARVLQRGGLSARGLSYLIRQAWRA